MYRFSVKHILPLLLLTVSVVMNAQQIQSEPTKEMVREAISWQMNRYPESTLKDLYKTCFQNRFGLGHLMNDSASAAEYLREELKSADESLCDDSEPTGIDGQFQRVSLSVVSKGKLTFEQFLSAFLMSAKDYIPMALDDWKKEWHIIYKEIKRMNLRLPNQKKDAREIKRLLKSGQYASHHSQQYNAAYHPHYRIIRTDVYNKYVEPYIK